MKKKMCISKKVYTIFLACTLAMSGLAGCSFPQIDEASEEETDTAETDDEAIELIDPVGVANEYAIVSYNSIYNADVITGVVSPFVTEYQYTSDAAFGGYGALPGDEVADGDVLIYGETESIEEQIENLSDEIRTKEEDYTEEITSLYENRYDAVKEEYRASCDYMEVKNDEPKEDEPWYAGWAAGVMPLESAYKNAKLNRKRIDTSISETEQLHELESAYDSKRLAKLESKRNLSLISSDTNGTLVATNYYSAGDFITKNSEVMAVGDMNTKVIYAPYLSAKAYSKLNDLYAVADGVRYEVTYEPVDQNEYSRLKQKNTDVYLPFYIEDPDNKLVMGQAISLVVMKDHAEDVLCVPTDAITIENGVSSVYLFGEDGSAYTQIETGVTGKMYTEVLSGVKAGDKVLSKSAVAVSKNTRTLEVGSSSQEFKGNGMLLYPSTEWLVNPAKYGNAYVSEILVDKNEAVTEGQEIIRLEIIPDSTAISRLQRKIARQQARLATLQKKKSQNYSNEVDYSLEQAIRQKNTAITRYTEELTKLQEYSGVITLTAKHDGIILNLAELKVGDHVNYNQNLICMADTTESILAIDNGGGKLGYGKEVAVTIKTGDGNPQTVTGTVVNVVDNALSSTLQSKTGLVRFKDEDAALVAEVGGSIQSSSGWGRSMFNVTATTDEVHNCVLVPRSAVVLKNGDTFVRVKVDDNNAQLVQFISGGTDLNNYWVICGLSEGMEICLD